MICSKSRRLRVTRGSWRDTATAAIRISPMLALAARNTGPDIGRHFRCALVEGKHDAVGDELLEQAQLSFVRLSFANRETVPTEALEDRDRGDRQPPEGLQILEGARSDEGIASAQLGQGVGIEDNRPALQGSAFRLLELAGEQGKVGRGDVGQAGRGQRQDLVGARRDIHIFSEVPAQQGKDLSLEAPPAPLSVGGNLLPQRSRETNGTSDQGFGQRGDYRAAHHQKSTSLVS